VAILVQPDTNTRMFLPSRCLVGRQRSPTRSPAGEDPLARRHEQAVLMIV
jgi:hypothetical protein